MITVSKEITFDMAHRLSNYKGKCYRLHGHTYRLMVTVGSNELSELGFVVDFGDLKEVLKDISDLFDHKTMLKTKDPVNVHLAKGMEEDWIYWVAFNPTAENMSAYIHYLISNHSKMKSVNLLSVKLWETPTSYAEYTKEIK